MVLGERLELLTANDGNDSMPHLQLLVVKLQHLEAARRAKRRS